MTAESRGGPIPISTVLRVCNRVGAFAFRLAEMSLVLAVVYYLVRTDPPLAPVWAPIALLFFMMTYVAERIVRVASRVHQSIASQHRPQKQTRPRKTWGEVIADNMLGAMMVGLFVWLAVAFHALAERQQPAFDSPIDKYLERLAAAVAGK